MARAKLTDTAKINIGTDDGAALVSLTQANKTQIQFTLNSTQFNDISGMTIAARLIEGNNDTDGTLPTEYKSGVSAFTIPVIEQAPSGSTNTFKLYFDAATILADWSPMPSPGNPVYGFISVTINDGAASNPQEYEILRGRVQFLESVE